MRETIHVAIVGPSGSGKTWLARRLASALGDKAVYVTLDNFYRDLSPLAPEERGKVNFDDPAGIDWDSVRSVMDELSCGKAAQAPDYDFATHTRKPLPRQVEAKDFIIWDGLWLLHETWLRERFHFSAFVDCPAAERLARRVTRDVLERGRTAESVRRQFQQQVEPMGEKFVEPQRQWANRRISSPVGEDILKGLMEQILAVGRDCRNRKP